MPTEIGLSENLRRSKMRILLGFNSNHSGATITLKGLQEPYTIILAKLVDYIKGNTIGEHWSSVYPDNDTIKCDTNMDNGYLRSLMSFMHFPEKDILIEQENDEEKYTKLMTGIGEWVIEELFSDSVLFLNQKILRKKQEWGDLSSLIYEILCNFTDEKVMEEDPELKHRHIVYWNINELVTQYIKIERKTRDIYQIEIGTREMFEKCPFLLYAIIRNIKLLGIIVPQKILDEYPEFFDVCAQLVKEE